MTAAQYETCTDFCPTSTDWDAFLAGHATLGWDLVNWVTTAKGRRASFRRPR